MGDDLSKGTTYATGGGGGQGVITSANLNAHVDDAVIKPTFISTKTERIPGDLADKILLESGGVLYRMFLSTLQTLLADRSNVYAGTVIQTVSATPYTANAALAVIPNDDTIPQITEGTQILTLDITPSFTSSRIRLVFNGFGGTTASASIIVALFRTGNVNALKTTMVTCTAGWTVELNIDWVDNPVSTTAQTYSVRAGPSSGVARLNGSSTQRNMGGSAACTLVAQEIR